MANRERLVGFLDATSSKLPPPTTGARSSLPLACLQLLLSPSIRPSLFRRSSRGRSLSRCRSMAARWGPWEARETPSLPGRDGARGPKHGEHTEEILAGLDLDGTAIAHRFGRGPRDDAGMLDR